MEESPAIRRRPLTCIVLAGILSLFAVTSGRGGNNDLFVIVSGLRSQEGNVHIALYDDPGRFPKSDGMVLRVEVPILMGVARHKFTGLTHKLYAVAVYHDENDNDEFDQGLLGIPWRITRSRTMRRYLWGRQVLPAQHLRCQKPKRYKSGSMNNQVKRP